MKTCRVCLKEKSESYFSKGGRTDSGKQRYQTICSSCFQEAYDGPRHKHLDALRAIWKNVPCADCGGWFPPECMDFDHRDPSTKRCAVSQAKSERALMHEMAKCEVVCANCHRIRSKKQLQEK